MASGSALQVFEELENTMAELYDWYAAAYADDAEASATFFRLAMEERNHARMVLHVRRASRQNSKAGEVDRTLTEGVAAMIEKARRFMGSETPPPLPEAIEFAVALELGAAEGHLRDALKGANPEMARLLESLGADDRAHAGRLERLAAERGLG